MAKLKLADAETIIDAALAEARNLNLAPLAVAVLDAGGHIIAFKREDGAGIVRRAEKQIPIEPWRHGMVAIHRLRQGFVDKARIPIGAEVRAALDVFLTASLDNQNHSPL
jgi:hypothetical protein